MTTVNPVLDVRAISKSYRQGRSEVHALREVSLRLETARSLAVMGRSGAGKTTLLNLLAGLDHPTRGEIWIAGEQLSALRGEAVTVFRRRHIGFVFQFFNLMPTLSALENVELPLLPERLSRRESRARAAAVLEQLGLDGRTEHRPDELSGGEQQRVAIARALVHQPELLLADEPTGNLDSATGEQVMDILLGLVRERHMALIVVTHAQAVATVCDEVVHLLDGRIVG